MVSPGRVLSEQEFQARLAFGQAAETTIARWLRRRGAAILPIYDIEYDDGKGPRLFGGGYQVAAPDLLIWSKGGTLWCETKHKSVWTWYRKEQRWETGINLNHYDDYQVVAQQTGLPVWLLFLHRQDLPDIRDRQLGSPGRCPVGLFGGRLDELRKMESHRLNRHGRHGMVYWAHSTLALLASLDEVERP